MTADFRYKKLGYVALSVTDRTRAQAYYANTVGLTETVDAEDGPLFFRCSDDHHNMVLYPADKPGVRRVGWEMENDAELEKAFEHFQQIGLNPAEVSAKERAQLKQGYSFRVREPNTGIQFEYYSTMLTIAAGYTPPLAKIERLGHVVFGVEKYDEAYEFFTKQMNFRTSDRAQGRLSFMRCFPNPFHHTLAIGKSAEGNRLSHVNFMVTDIDDIGISYNRLRYADVPIMFGPGRHPPSDSIFLYFMEPDGMTLEYSFGMEEFAEVGARKARMLEPTPQALDSWGARPDPRFGATGDIETEDTPFVQAAAAE